MEDEKENDSNIQGDPPKPLSAFFLFCQNERPKAQKAFKEDGSDEKRSELGQVQKLLGEQWRSLDAEAKQSWDAKAFVMKQRWLDHQRTHPGTLGSTHSLTHSSQSAPGQSTSHSNSTEDSGISSTAVQRRDVGLFPHARISRIVKSAVTGKITKEALAGINKASALFLMALTEQSNSARLSRKHKVKTIALDDIEKAIRGGGPKFSFLLDAIEVISLSTPTSASIGEPDTTQCTKASLTDDIDVDSAIDIDSATPQDRGEATVYETTAMSASTERERERREGQEMPTTQQDVVSRRTHRTKGESGRPKRKGHSKVPPTSMAPITNFFQPLQREPN